MASSSVTRWSSRPPSGSRSSTPPTRAWSSAASTSTPTIDPLPRYIGRIGVRNADRDVLLIDWRAPAAGVFYQATAATPQGVVRRRVLRSLHRTVIGVEDELLDDQAETDLPIVGEGALMAQLSRARDRSMHSIVATIQAEQDQAIRAPGKGVVSISGGPGTGKTVVALHRAAFLLYSDRRRYEGGGVLVVGPSGVFMRYIERVLPSLGETAVALRSLGEVVGGIRATRHDEPAVADIKGATRMAELLRRTSRQHAPGAPTSFRIYWFDETIVLDPGLLGRLRRQLMSQGRRNRQLPRVARTLLDAMWRQVKGDRGRERGREAFDDDMLSHDGFVEFATQWWPPLDALTVLGWLREPEFLSRVGEGVVTREEQLLLSKSWAAGDLSIEDVPLLDELRYAIGDVPQRSDDERDLDETGLLEGGVDLQELTTISEREYAPGGLAWSAPTHRIEDDGYAHVLIDEAQDLTPMQWRMVGRRGRAASWTIVGDPAQSSWPDAPEAARARAEALEGKELHEFHLSTNYRNSAEIYSFAAAYARRVGLDADLPDAVRRTGEEPAVVGPGRRPRGVRACRRRRDVGPGRGHRRHRRAGRPALRGQRLAGVVAGVRRRLRRARAPRWTRGSRRAARTASWCSPASTPRAWSSTASSWSGRRRSRRSRPPVAPRSTSC